MTNTSTLLLDGRLADGRLVDLRVTDGIITEISDVAENADRRALDAHPGPVHHLNGWLLVPSLAEPHAHLDKALTAELVPNPGGDLMGAIDAWVAASAAGHITYDGIVERAIAAMDLLLVHGVTAVRTHVNVLESIGATAVKAVLEAASEFEGLLDVQVVALCGSPLTGRNGAGTRAALVDALEAGAHLVGGCPHLDPDGVGLIDIALRAATEAGIGVDLHVDEMLDPTVLTLRDLAQAVLTTGFAGRVAASHCVTLGMQTAAVQREVSDLVAEAGIAVFPLPQTNLFLQGRAHQTGTPRPDRSSGPPGSRRVGRRRWRQRARPVQPGRPQRPARDGGADGDGRSSASRCRLRHGVDQRPCGARSTGRVARGRQPG